ncbi:putative component of anaerobic dehydrogenase [Desulfitobacterium dichloroeliminans LMG P-21439]|uniref:Putative component of anaerobic dehydrogenase n=1 Tax=Desulfitobacterium dichloroeliminans (strain LMG P-21439 / DCA1) TaxID=871963 RepID=L0F538_DESDL|nr:molecular chaperone TorD family protein [Desulfitobacterium dichloroeliminans]AGA68028.1 putative component of anaerobic dehydrogenase [Desulfitobacterium dichloroeliminans LMG P-21439]
MIELKSSPENTAQPLGLAVQIEMLNALSRVFSAGGENLDQTLARLTQAYGSWLEARLGDLPGDQELLYQLKEGQEREGEKRLVYEFNRLFVGPQSPPAPPYESVYRYGERQVMQKSTLDVRQWYRSEGLSLAGRSNEPDDYIATELEFAAYLLSNAIEQYRKDQPQKAKVYKDRYNAFCHEHLAVWLPSFVQTLSASTREQFYITLGKIIQRVVKPV